MPHLCVFAASSRRLDPQLYERTRDLGESLGRQGWDLVFGGANIGLMEAVAQGFKAAGARIVSVIPRLFDGKGLTWTAADEIILTEDLRDRKRVMDSRAAAFLVLPGGPGTADEFFEILTLKQIGIHDRPIVLVDHEGHWQGLLELLDRMHEGGFAAQHPRDLIEVATDFPAAARILGRP